MIWCDSLASTPTVGVRLDPQFRPAEEILSALAPVFNKELDEKSKPAFNIELMDPLSLTVNTESGFRYSFDHSGTSIAFNHRIRARAASAGPPVMELISQAAPYTELLNTVTERLIEAVDLANSGRSRRVTRIGVVSTTQVTLDDAPPGIVDLFGKVALPFGGEADNFNMTVTTKLRESSRGVERCAHTLTLPEPPERLITLQIDWQRVFPSPIPATRSSLLEVMNQGRRDALAYFERVAEGGLNDATS